MIIGYDILYNNIIINCFLMSKGSGIFFGFIKKSKKAGKRYNFSLLAELLALIFLGLSEHPMNSGRWIVLILMTICATLAFVANE